MAISLGATSENLLRGIDRMIVSVASILPTNTARRQQAIPRAWGANRGTEILRAQVDLSGGFPGSLRWQQNLTNTTLHLTESWLIIGEGTNFGFALPLKRIAGVSVQDCGGLQPPCLVVWFQDAEVTGSFRIGFRGTARNRAGMFRAEWLHHHLTELEITSIDSETARFVPSIHCTWDEITDFADDEIRFTGTAVASVAGPFGSELDTAEVWITEHSLIWCAQHGEGFNRLALETIIDCRNGFGDRLAIGIEDACGGRYDLYFDFGSNGERAQTAAQVKQLLAANGIPTGTAVVPVAPWRSGGTRRPTDI